MTTTAPRDYDFRVIEVELIDPPPLAMREQMDPTKLLELRDSIRLHGVLSPLGVYERDTRFVIIYGHRRYEASKLAGEPRVPCRVHRDGTAREEDYKFTENYYREDVNPAEEATWFAELLERKHQGNIETLCAELHVTESYVNGRLDLLRGDELVLAALRAKEINLAVARELNKIRDEGYRRLYLGDSIDLGLTATAVQAKRLGVERLAVLADAEARLGGGATAPSAEVPLVSIDRCLICGSSAESHNMEYVRVHRDCHSMQRRMNEERGGAQ